MFKNNDGFTLIEMLIVLTIISTLIILIIPNIGKSSEEVHEKSCDALVTVVQTQVNLYYLEKGEYPEKISDLVSDGYLTEAQTQCSENKPLEIDDDGEVNTN